MAFELPPLPYDYAALEPHIDELTMRIHHDKHHGAYVTNANAALANYPDLAALSVEDLLKKLEQVPADIRTAVRNNAGGHANIHSSGRSSRRMVGHSKREPCPLPSTKHSEASSRSRSSSPRRVWSLRSGWAWLTNRFNRRAPHRVDCQPGIARFPRVALPYLA